MGVPNRQPAEAKETVPPRKLPTPEGFTTLSPLRKLLMN